MQTAIRAVRGVTFDKDLQADVLRVWGYTVRCDCGWQGSIRATFAQARRDRREHLESDHALDTRKGRHG